jgi:hypothetical protein
LEGLLLQFANSGPIEGFYFMCSAVAGDKPRDKLEAMLAAQMAAVHVASMKSARDLAYAPDQRQREGAPREIEAPVDRGPAGCGAA